MPPLPIPWAGPPEAFFDSACLCMHALQRHSSPSPLGVACHRLVIGIFKHTHTHTPV